MSSQQFLSCKFDEFGVNEFTVGDNTYGVVDSGEVGIIIRFF